MARNVAIRKLTAAFVSQHLLYFQATAAPDTRPHLRIREEERVAEKGCVDPSRDKPAVEPEARVKGSGHLLRIHSPSFGRVAHVEHLLWVGMRRISSLQFKHLLHRTIHPIEIQSNCGPQSYGYVGPRSHLKVTSTATTTTSSSSQTRPIV